jgi:hypothetical protein
MLSVRDCRWHIFRYREENAMILSDHFKRALAIIGVLIALLLGAYVYMSNHIHDVIVGKQTLLPPQDTEQITVDPSSHKLTIKTKTGYKILTLPDRVSTIDVHKDGTVNVTSPQLGFQHHMFLGVVGSDHIRLGAGADLFYWKKLDFGVGMADQVGMYAPIVFAKLTYNIKGNMQAGLVYGSNQYIGGVLAVRLF